MRNNLGTLGEMAASKYLKKKRYKLYDVNYRSRFGEIDLIVTKDNYIVFVEVKSRTANSIANPCEFVDERKQERIIKTAELYLVRHRLNLQPRFDVIEVFFENDKIKSIKHLENAFQLL